MSQTDLSPAQILQVALDKADAKIAMPLSHIMILAFLGGVHISFGSMAYLRVVSGVSADWGGLAAFVGAAVFPIGLIAIALCGGELLTGNMMYMAAARALRRISWATLCRNWFWVALGNLLGALAAAYFFGHYAGVSEGGVRATTIAVANAKVAADFAPALVSAVACNWLVCLGVWLSLAARHTAGRIMAIWFPVMVFVLIGFQHVVANMFLIPAGIFAGAEIGWSDFVANLVPVFLGNAIGGAVFVGGAYAMVYGKKPVE